MKKSEALRKILKKLKDWENCRMEYRTAKEILEVVEKEIGMRGPHGILLSLTRGDGWAPEGKRKTK